MKRRRPSTTTPKQAVIACYPQATLFKSENGYYILNMVPMGKRIEFGKNPTPAAAWKSAAEMLAL